jgi:putative colanic acid biosynthesis UDP-glucose lipid carrier transferase
MFEDRTYKRTFYSAPQSVTSLVAAFLEPAITVLTFLAANWYLEEPVTRAELTLCLLVSPSRGATASGTTSSPPASTSRRRG